MLRRKKADRDGVYQRRDGFYCSFIDALGIRKFKKLKGCISLTVAKQLRAAELLKVTEQIASGRPQQTEETFSEVIPTYLQYQHPRLKPRSYSRTAGIIENHLLPAFGEMKLARIRKPDILAYLTKRATPKPIAQSDDDRKEKRPPRVLSAGSRTKELNTLKSIFHWAIAAEKLTHDPTVGIKGPKLEPGRVRYLQPTELRVVLQRCPAWLQPIAGLLAFTGCRRSEVLNLRWMDVDRQRGLFLLPQTKNNEPRIVWLNNLALRVIDSLPKNGHKPTDRVFDGRSPEDVSLSFLRTCRRAGVENFRLHDLRHTAASWLAMQGADIHLVAEMLGHRDLRMAKRYRHLNPAFLQGAARTLDTAFGPELQGLPLLNPSHDECTIEHENVPKEVQVSASQ